MLGGFTGDLKTGFMDAENHLRTKAQVEVDYQETLVRNEAENRRAVSAAEDILFTSFTRELAQRVDLSPQYVSRRAGELNEEPRKSILPKARKNSRIRTCLKSYQDANSVVE